MLPVAAQMDSALLTGTGCAWHRPGPGKAKKKKKKERMQYKLGTKGTSKRKSRANGQARTVYLLGMFLPVQ